MTDYGIVVSDFAIFHNEHLSLFEEAFKVCEKLIVFVGSSESSLDIKHPLSYEERVDLINTAIGIHFPNRDIQIFSLPDQIYNDFGWKVDLKYRIEDLTNNSSSVILIKSTSLNSKEVLNSMYSSWLLPEDNFKNLVPDCVYHSLKRMFNIDYVRKGILIEEFEFVRKYKEAWKSAPYPPIFVTVDSLVVCDGKVLVIKRGGNPGKGKLALPGGFLNQDEYIRDACIRELIEETAINISAESLGDSIVDQKVFDYPDRSTRGRTITHAFMFNLEGFDELPSVIASDDAASVLWMSLSEMKASERIFYEDHYQMISYFINEL